MINNKDLEKLIEKRKGWVKSSEENKFDFDSILAGLYNNPSHFIYEILQNAEDEGAKKVRFELLEDRLDVYHNGKDFDLEDIDGVTGIGISKKKDDLTTIGKFGVGFKSVFAVTETPYIFSGEYRIKIEDFVIPSVVSDNGQVNGTLISIPFNHKLRSRGEVFKLISEKLPNIGLKTLLFLKNIEDIEWQTPSSSGYYSKSSKHFQKIKNTKKVAIKSLDVTEEYIVVEKPVNIEGKKLKVEVAYKLGRGKKGKKIIVQEPNSKLVVFFPTDKPTYLNFVIQGPYRTTPNRESIPLEDKQNKAIIEETGNLVVKSLSVIKKLGFLDVGFLNILPLTLEDKENEPIYSTVYEKVKEKLLSERMLPTSDGKYTKADNALLTRSKELTEFLDKKDIQGLFSKQKWLNTNITYDKTRELRNYLINELNVQEVDFENFAEAITAEFLQAKSDKWIVDFYKRLLGKPNLWDDNGGILRTKPIIRLETNEDIAPFNNRGEIQVYLPTETKSKYKTVKCILTKDKGALKFLQKLGLTKPDLFAEVKEFILPKYQTSNPAKDKEYFEDFEKLLTAYENIPTDKRREFLEGLSKASFIVSVRNGTGENYLRRPSETYFNDKDLKEYFEGYQPVYFVSDELYEKFGEERIKTFFIDLSVEDNPRQIEIDGNLSWEEKSRLRGNDGCTYDIYQKDYEYEGLVNFIEHMTINKSYLLWKLLLKDIGTLNTREAQKFFKGEYSWFYYWEKNEKFDAKFTKMLRQHKWFVDKNNNFRKPSDIAFSELSDNYTKESPNIEILVKTLGFMSEIIEQLPEDDRRTLEIRRRYGASPEEIEKLLSESREKSLEKEEETWTPQYHPDEVYPIITEADPEKIITPDLTGQSEKEHAKTEIETAEQEEKTEEKDKQKKILNKKTIGKWGEECVELVLKNKYSAEEFEIVWLNRENDAGEGCDFVIKKDGLEILYIEVKTKTQEEPEFIEATGPQWEFARKLFEQNEGEKYCFYVVLNAGEEKEPPIRILKNPIKLWKEGKLYAHPVNFKL